jgi:protein ImuA
MLWVSATRKLFPPSLSGFGVKPDQVIFIDVRSARDALWATEESLKCNAVTAVVAEVGNLDLTSSRRLQLAAEQSRSTGFLIRNDARQSGITCSVSRWRIASIAGSGGDGFPGVGYPEWKVELLRLRNGRPGAWRIRWKQGRFEDVMDIGHREVDIRDDRKAG